MRRREWEEEEEEAFLSPLVDFSSENLCLKLRIILLFHAPVLGSPPFVAMHFYYAVKI